MTEAEFNAMMARAQQKKAEQQDLFRARAERRETALRRALQTNRVVPNFTQATEQTDSELRRRFDADMSRLMRQHLGEQIGRDDDEAE